MRKAMLLAWGLACAAVGAAAARAAGPESKPMRQEGMRPHACDAERSSITYTVFHRLNTVHGTSHAAVCTVWVDADTSRFRISVRAPVRSFRSGNGLRDGHAMKAVRADRYPTVEFTSDFARPLDGRLGPYRVKGELLFNGVRKPLEMRVTPDLRGGMARVRGSFPLLLSDFQVERPSLMGMPVWNGAHIEFALAFPLPAARPVIAP